MDLAIESGLAANASHKIDGAPRYSIYNFGVYEKRRFLWLIPYWVCLHTENTIADCEAWLQANWKLPRFYHITRKPSHEAHPAS